MAAITRWSTGSAVCSAVLRSPHLPSEPLLALRSANQLLTRAEATQKAQKGWAQYVQEQGEGLLSNQVDSWMTGINSNLKGRQTRIIARYSGSAQSYRNRCDEVAENGYKGLNLV